MAVALAIMLAPQPGAGVFVMIFSVGHIGTAAPVMLTWLVLDRFPRRRYVPAIVGALLADPLVLVIAIIPVLAVATLRLVPALMRPGIPNGGALRRLRHAFTDRWLEVSLLVRPCRRRGELRA